MRARANDTATPALRGARALRAALVASVCTGSACAGRGSATVSDVRPPVRLPSAARGPVVARVDGAPITAGEVETAGKIAGVSDPHRALELVVRDRLLAREARRRGSVTLLDEDVTRRALMQSLLVHAVDDEVSAATISADVYESARNFFGFAIAHGPVATVKHIVLTLPRDRAVPEAEREGARAAAERVRARLLALPASERAEALESLCPAACGGQAFRVESIGPFEAEGRMAQGNAIEPPFARAGIALATEGDVSPVTPTAYGYHVLVLTARGPAIEMPPEQLRERVLAEALPRLRSQRFEALLRSLRARAHSEASPASLEAVGQLDLSFAPPDRTGEGAARDPRAGDREESP